ncbi:hypothetical protein WJX72_002004 [[Myrmecia] bisecta]|uniref:Uncharacterized protein n=1 Tax=[Myrmecia] bisecta TaxID=41462 RepID=A0AAW1QEW1_9CHLO
MEEGDAERWAELGSAGLSSSVEDDPGQPGDHIGPVEVQGTVYCYTSQTGTALQLQVGHQKEKGLSFQVWPSSLTLSKYAELMALQHPQHWQGKRVLELGCGCGLMGLVFAALGAQVMLTDMPQVLALMDANIARNASIIQAAGGSAQACELTWGQTSVSLLACGWDKPDLVVAADVIYHRELFEPLLSTLKSLGNLGTQILLAHVRRWKSDKHFFSKARQSFTVTDITHTVDAGAADCSSRTRGAMRLFQLTPLPQTLSPGS